MSGVGPSRGLPVALVAVTFALAGCGGDRGDRASAPAPADAIERAAEKGPVKLSVRAWPRRPRLSDLLQLEVSVEAAPGVEVKPPAFGQAVGDFLVRDYNERPVEAGAGKGEGRGVRRRFRYELEPTHAGKHLIRSLAIEFVDRRPGAEGGGAPALVETEPMEVEVTSDLGEEAPSLDKLQPMVPPRAAPGTIAWAWLAAGGGAVALAVAGVWALRRRRRRPVEPRRPSPEEVAHAALSRLLAEDLPARGLVKEFYLRLTGIVRRYVEDTTGIRAPEQTTEEFLRDIRSRAAFPPDRSARLADFLESADLVKYAGQVPGEGQIERAIDRAREFVNLESAQAQAQTQASPSAVAAGG